MRASIPLIIALTFLTVPALAQDKADDKPTADELLEQAVVKFRAKMPEEAIKLATQAIELDPAHVAARASRASMYDALEQYDKAVADYTAALKLEPKAAQLHQRRGAAHFKLGHIKQSIADFDKFLEAHPDDEPHHWQRGISYYYAGEYAKGVAQFESHKKVNPEDVENAVWHYLCKAKIDGVEKARAALIPIKSDPRSWAAGVYEMYRGELSPDKLLKDMEDIGGREFEVSNRLFYTHLYIGLFHEADGKDDLAKQHITIAAEKYPSNHYMGDVARVHADLFKKAKDGDAAP